MNKLKDIAAFLSFLALLLIAGWVIGGLIFAHSDRGTILREVRALDKKLDRALELNTIDTVQLVKDKLNAEAKLADMEIIHSSEAELEDLKKRYNDGGILPGVVMK